MSKRDLKIKTPDQRLRVFVSSTLKELSEERKAVRKAIETLHLIPVMFELGARPHPPKDLYQAYLDQSNIFIGIYWQSYGWIAENEKISGLEDELMLSENFPRLIYVKEPAPEREEKLSHMLEFIRSRGNVSYKSFSTIEELSDFTANDLAILISERFYSPAEIQKETKKSGHNNLPAHLPHIIGREKEKKEICDLILNKESYLITITGPGGIGKTRLSLEIGKSLTQYFEDGVYFADFSGVFDESKIYSELAKVLGITLVSSVDSAKQIVDFVSDDKILLIIDNFEQLSHAASVISGIVKNCHNLVVIVTSRNPLELSIETEYSIESLSFPEKDKYYNLSDLEFSASIMLFSERAKSVYKNFELTGENVYTVSDICRLLGGIPLAIELAAAKIKMFSLNTIKERLSKKIDLLTGGMKDAPERHKTMKAALEWSYDLLNEDEKKIFRRLSVFENGFDYEALENICCFDIKDPPETIESLFSKKFFKEEEEINGIPRFNMLVLLRNYASELFELSGEENVVKNILTEYYLNKALKESSGFYGAVEAKISSAWEIDIQNVMTAIENLFIQKRYTDLIEMIYALWPVFWIFNHDNILERRTDLSLIFQHRTGLSDDLYGKLNWLEASAAMEKGDLNTAGEKFRTANRFFKLTENIRGIAWTNLLISSLKSDSDKEKNAAETAAAFISSAELFRISRDKWGESVAMQYSAAFHMTNGNYKKAIEDFDICIKLIKEMESLSLKGYFTAMKALAYIEMDENQKAFDLLKESSETIRNEKFNEATAYILLICAYYYFRINDYSRGMLLSGICSNIFSKYNFVPWHMLSTLFTNIKIYVKSFSDGEYAIESEKGLNTNIFKASELLYELIHSGKESGY